MAQKKRKKVLQISPVGIAVWPWVNKADTKYDEDGVYRVKLACDPNEPKAAALVKAIDAGVQKALADQKAEDEKGSTKRKYKVMEDLPYAMEKNDADEETGRILFSFKLKAKGKTKEGEIYDRKVALFNADGSALTKMVGGGSKLQISYELNTFYIPTKSGGAGVSLRMEAVRVLELVEYNGRDAKGYGFDTDDEYSGAGDEDESPATAAKAGTDDDEDDDDLPF